MSRKERGVPGQCRRRVGGVSVGTDYNQALILSLDKRRASPQLICQLCFDHGSYGSKEGRDLGRFSGGAGWE